MPVLLAPPHSFRDRLSIFCAAAFLADSQPPSLSPQDAYEVVRKVGRGKYSEVFEGIRTASSERCIIKARRRRPLQRPRSEPSVRQSLSRPGTRATTGL